VSLYFEDMGVGMEWVSGRRTITETDVVMFGSLTGDQHPAHFDDEFCKATSPFKTRVAHGMIGLTYALGLLSQSNVMTTTALAFLGYKRWDFKGPLRIGDTIRGRLRVLDKKEARTGAGLVTFQMSVMNQKDEEIQEGEYIVMVARKPL